MIRYLLPIILGLAHGAADGATGWLLGSVTHSMSLAQLGALVVLYNMLALGGQPIVGLLTDRLQRPRVATLIGLLLSGLALITFEWHLVMAIVLAGVGSAAFHTGGGALALCATRNRATGPGIFAAPGVVGLALGGALAVTGHQVIWPLLILLLMLGFAIASLPLPRLPYAKKIDQPLFESHDVIMLVLLAGIALRSMVWNTLQFLYDGQVTVLVALGLAAAVGKILGGILADRLGWRRWVVSALLVAAPLLTFAGHHLGALLLGAALLQSVTPVGLVATAQLLPRQPATAAGLAIGLALTLGGFPLVGGLALTISTPPILLLVMIGAALALGGALGLQRKYQLTLTRLEKV